MSRRAVASSEVVKQVPSQHSLFSNLVTSNLVVYLQALKNSVFACLESSNYLVKVIYRVKRRVGQ